LEQYSDLLYTRKPKINRVLSKQKLQDEKTIKEEEMPFEKEIRVDEDIDIESQALAILNQNEEEKNEIEELMSYLKEKSKDRIQKAKIFYKNLKFNFEVLEEYQSDDESEIENKSKKKIKRIKNRVITEALETLNK
jgi:hypothetical protein